MGVLLQAKLERDNHYETNYNFCCVRIIKILLVFKLTTVFVKQANGSKERNPHLILSRSKIYCLVCKKSCM